MSGSVSGADYVGGIVGYCNGSISGCSFSGTVSGANSVGGIAGLSAGSISKCSAADNISGRSYVGGITGHQYGGSIAASSNSAAVTGTGSYTGGITGNAERCTLSDCTNTGSISGDTAGRLKVRTTGEGEGTLYRSGQCIPIRWSRADRNTPFTYTTADGQPLALGRGNSYVCLIDPRTSRVELS